MREESRKQRLENLANLGKALNAWHFVYAIILVTFFPYLTKGTTIHEHVMTFSRYSTIGIIIAPFYVKLVNLILQWYVKTGRTLESFTFVPLLLLGALVGALISYIILRIFEHEGNWETTFIVSHEDVIISLFSNILIALSSGFYILIIIYYRKGQNIIMKSKKSTSFRKFVITFSLIPLLFLLIIFLIYITNK